MPVNVNLCPFQEILFCRSGNFLFKGTTPFSASRLGGIDKYVNNKCNTPEE
jgi:hypothetical protein